MSCEDTNLFEYQDVRSEGKIMVFRCIYDQDRDVRSPAVFHYQPILVPFSK